MSPDLEKLVTNHLSQCFIPVREISNIVMPEGEAILGTSTEEQKTSLVNAFSSENVETSQQALNGPSQSGYPESQQNKQIAQEFIFLMEKSQHVFIALKDLPPTATPKQWQPFFQRAFEIFTRLWKYQQEHRTILEQKEYYGIKRWEIGEIASKIGQLYYHYYLRTSETSYLLEASVFYEAIRDRAYFKEAFDTNNPQLVLKKMRYYARFLVISLLLNKREFAKVLLDELDQHVKDYIGVFKPSDSQEWNEILKEVVQFLDADKNVVPVDYEGAYLPVETRLANIETNEKGLKLTHSIIVGNYPSQIKFSELSLDMFRMLQAIERQPKMRSEDKSLKRFNPTKHLLYRPSFSTLFQYMANCFKDISDNGVLLLYFSGEGTVSENSETNLGGISTSTKKDQVKSIKECLHLTDIVPFTRKPLVLIADSNVSNAYSSFTSPFDSPTLFLLSPTKVSEHLKDPSVSGNLFTLFLLNPILAICMVCNISEIQADIWAKAKEEIQNSEISIINALKESNDIHNNIKVFLNDEFLSRIISRFVFSKVLLSLSSKFNGDPCLLPNSVPHIPDSFYSGIIGTVKSLLIIMNVADQFQMPQ
ncbi:hypothetical protein ROZALSC1DRAFT_27090 [Rozella allomycis CSF55]|uniref:Protein SCAI n=1 Tax=Rozella allomycis (strain CSF55) TaxID=988480 RepID=A0A075AYF4_ROZAC|nr:Protein of unknown function DUF3550/UPF0682 domain-containing protein [Rozella allomycis CSF55]RKP21506.1 hypothetical protein ROZALSC1DRAFT_27090 [Rozella allomycis CSF55]|eukprot:EPZ35312.1 Protein of unknown function DUF3550/UPF0682 domain-containing protein [Rozella allomycis CSF55]